MSSKLKLKVYGWLGWRQRCPPAPNGSKQTREIVAAASRVAAARAYGYGDTRKVNQLEETGNDEEIAQAMSEPGEVFWHPLDELRRKRRWRKA